MLCKIIFGLVINREGKGFGEWPAASSPNFSGSTPRGRTQTKFCGKAIYKRCFHILWKREIYNGARRSSTTAVFRPCALCSRMFRKWSCNKNATWVYYIRSFIIHKKSPICGQLFDNICTKSYNTYIFLRKITFFDVAFVPVFLTNQIQECIICGVQLALGLSLSICYRQFKKQLKVLIISFSYKSIIGIWQRPK